MGCRIGKWDVKNMEIFTIFRDNVKIVDSPNNELKLINTDFEMSRKMLEKSKITTNLLKDLLINSPGKCILSTKMTKIDDADDTLFLTYPYYQKSTSGH